MGLLEKIGLKKKKEETKPEAAVETSKKEEVRQVEKKPTAASRAYRILIRPVLSEKATHLATLGKYVFAVHPQANKSEIKKSIQRVYDVHIEQVKIIKLPGKMRRYGRSAGRTSAWKKAVVSVRAGEKIPGIIEAVG